ncbi:Alkylated DNA nucleotide flippase Atl1, participates in nucleotide excision repair, Ada-like DNA-binding domain [Nocardia amikacinitolerans]|nr:Alkylated DNA nucleotide flippase Atl1, participates in nucleotide excision repair, Ada-like DNA-binding domain [Nocardia amikacinitolerans]
MPTSRKRPPIEGDPQPVGQTKGHLRSAGRTSDAQIELVRELVASIPPGMVATYGDIAAAAGLSTPRTVGWIMRTDAADLPWHRVLRAGGRPATHLADRQLRLLAAEDVPIEDGRVNLREARFRFPEVRDAPRR